MVGRIHVVVDMVKLSERQSANKLPGAAIVAGNSKTSVIAFNHISRISGAPPKSVVVGMYFPSDEAAEGFSAVNTLAHRAVEINQAVFIGRVDVDLVVIKRAVINALFRHQRPLVAPVC